MPNGKVVGKDQIRVKVQKCMSEEGPKWLTELFNAISYDCKDAQ